MSTSKKSIEHLRAEDPAIDAIVNWREHQKIRDSFCAPVLACFPDDSPDLMPVTCEIKTTRVHTRRLAAADPNMLAMPTRSELGLRVREGFICPEGQVFGSWDLSQIEMRYMAHVSRDPLLHDFFNDPKKDVHAETAARIFGLPINEKGATKKDRYHAIDEMAHRYPSKRAGFGIITNIQGAGLYDQLRMFGCEGWSEQSCKELIQDWLNLYKGVKEYLEACKREAHAKGYVVDEWGMKRYLMGAWSPDRRSVAEAERAASSHKISGGAQGMLQNSMHYVRQSIRDLQRSGLNVHWCLQIHDEVILRFDEDLWEVVDALVMDALKNHHGVKMTVPVDAEGSMSRSWGGL